MRRRHASRARDLGISAETDVLSTACRQRLGVLATPGRVAGGTIARRLEADRSPLPELGQRPAPRPASRAAPSAVDSVCGLRWIGSAEQVGLELEERVGPRHAAVDADSVRAGCRGRRSSPRSGRRPGTRPLRAWPGRGRRRRWHGSARRSPRAPPAPSRVRPARSSAGTKTTSLSGSDSQGQRVDLGRGPDRLETVAEPLNGGPGDEHAPFEGVLRRPIARAWPPAS